MIKFYLDTENNLIVRDRKRGKTAVYPCGTWEEAYTIRQLNLRGAEIFNLRHSTKRVLIGDVANTIVKECSKEELLELIEGLE